MSERVLYKPIEDMFVRKGYLSISDRGKLPSERVHSPFGVNVHGVTKKIDVVAFREINGEIEAKAVECKSGRTWKPLARPWDRQLLTKDSCGRVCCNKDGRGRFEAC